MINQIFQENNNNKENDKDLIEPIRTSATIREKNYIQLKIQAEKLNIPKYQLGILCLDYMIKNQHERLTKKEGTIEYNSPDTYCTLGLIYENHDKFELFLSLKNINRISISYLMDYALEMFLSIVIDLILNKLNKNNLQENELLDLFILSIQNIDLNFQIDVGKKHFYSNFIQFILKE